MKEIRGEKIGGVFISRRQLVCAGSAWQPKVGERVKVVRGFGCGAQFVGQFGKVVKSRGLGRFKVRLDSGKSVNFDSSFLSGE